MARTWRFLAFESSDAADLAALPAAVIEGRVAGRYIMAAKAAQDTVIIQHMRSRGILAGAEVIIDREEAARKGIDVAVQPKAGRGSIRPVGTVSVQELMLGSEESCESVQRSKDDLAALIYTSGTTGEPKGVELTHGNFDSECTLAVSILKTDSTDRFASLVPYFHVFGLADGLAVPIHRKLSIVLVPQYSPRTFIDTIEKSSPTVILAIPTQYTHLITAARRRPVTIKRPLKYCISGAAPLPAKAVEEFRERFGSPIVEGYGMTETTAATTLNPVENVKPGSIGPACPGIEMRVVDDAGRPLPDMQSGEIVIRGPTVCRGYYNRPQDTREAFDSEGYLRSGDIGYRDTDGFYFVTDRKKDIIIKGGYNISPREIEDCLLKHDCVEDAAVVGYRNDDLRETIVAFCVPAENCAVTPADILAHCRKSLAQFKTPDRVLLVDSLPKNAAGKVLRRELRVEAAEARGGGE